MRTLKQSWVLILSILAFSSCKRDNLADKADETTRGGIAVEASELMVPAGFNLETEKTLNVRVKVADADPKQRYVIKIYADVPASGKLISTGLTKNGEYGAKVRVPSWLEYVYIERISADGSSRFEKVKANHFVSTTINSAQQAPYIIRKSGSGMDCSTGCTVTYNNPTSDITVNSGDVACITGTVSGINVYVNGGGVAKICASGTLGELIGQNNSEVYILENTILSLTQDMVMFTDCIFKNYSDSLRPLTSVVFYDCDAENHGKMYHTSNYGMDLFQHAVFTNNGEVHYSSNLMVLDNGTVVNNNKLFANAVINDGDATITNNCYLEAAGDFYTAGKVTNNAYIKAGTYWQDVAQYISVSPQYYTKLNDGAMISAANLKLVMGDIEGTGTNRSKIKISGNTNISSGTTIDGIVDLCDANGIESNSGTISSPALASCAGYIATSTCNPEGFGSNSSQDADNDGVADAQDEYPNDATRAFNSYYPNAATMATVAFEDLWPARADYDFNDLSILFNIQQVLNANNEVVDYKVKLKVKAVGGSFVNGFGFQLDDVLPSEISNVTGQVLVNNIITRNSNNTESGQDKAVIIVYDTPEPTLHRISGSMFNTIKTNPVGTSDTIRINITFTNPVQDTKLGMDKFNPFMFTNQRRGYEVHLGNFRPTTLANTALFGTFEDRTNVSNNIYYKNANGMPWAILIPEEFAHAIEKASITSAYNFFDDWAASGGTTNTNWYANSPGNRNASNLY